MDMSTLKSHSRDTPKRASGSVGAHTLKVHSHQEVRIKPYVYGMFMHPSLLWSTKATLLSYTNVVFRDLKSLQSGKAILNPARSFTHHSNIVNDVQYHPVSRNFIGSVSDDLTLQILDVRQPSDSQSSLVAKNGHSDAINALSFNPSTEVLVATASADHTIGIWDLRNVKEKIHTLEGHKDAVTSLAWHPHEAGILGSASYDRRIIFWDLSRVGEEQQPEDQDDGPPEL